MRLSRLGQRPIAVVLVAAVAIAFSGILYRVADVSPSTGAFFRCLWALPPLWLLARMEDRLHGPRSARARRLAWLAGALLAVLTGIAYAIFLIALREGSRDLRRVAGPLFDATLASAVGCAVAGVVGGDLDLAPSLESTAGP